MKRNVFFSNNITSKLFISLVFVLFCAASFAQLEVRTAEDLNNVRQNMNGEYVQVADIDLEGMNWTPIGTSRNPFGGTYDGGGHVIRNLTIERDGADTGLFAGLSGGVVKNVGIENANIRGGANTGGLVAQLVSNGLIENCYISGEIIGTSNVGLLVGHIRASAAGTSNRIRDSYAVGSATAEFNIGGLAGVAVAGEVTNSYASVYVDGDRDVGGLIGGNAVAAEVTASFWDTQASGTGTSQGGTGLTTEQMLQRASFTGWNFRGTWLIQEDETYPYLDWQREPAEHNYPSEEGLPSNLVGTPGNGELFLNWDAPPVGEWTAYNIYRNGERYDSVDREVNQYNDRNVENYTQYSYYVTAILPDDRESRASNTVVVTPHLPFAGGDGSIDEPFQVATAQNLNDIRYNLISHFIQIEDINIGVAPWNQGEGWKPIGYYVNAQNYLPFQGSFNGNGHVITGLTIITPDNNFVGLFGYVKEVIITDLVLEEIIILANDNVGGVTARAGGTTEFTGCYVTGEIEARNTVGGIIGQYESGGETIITDCHFSGSIAGGGTLGGIIADMPTGMAGEINYSSFTGTITGTGGIVAGISAINRLDITGCFFNGEISGGTHTGGIAANNHKAITKSYALGTLTQTGFSGGGIASKNWGTSSITYCYVDMDIVAYRVTGGIIGAHGDNNNLNPIVSNCYVRGSITASDEDMSIMIGGLAGHSYANIENSYSASRVTGPEDEMGGLVGRRSGGNVVNSYWDTEVSGTELSTGGEGRLTRQMVYPYDETTYVGWDFAEIWQDDPNELGNDGYPMLSWQEVPDLVEPPVIDISIVNIDGVDHSVISWEGVEGALSYKVFAANDLRTANWGEPIGIVGEPGFQEQVENSNRFYRVVSSIEPPPGD